MPRERETVDIGGPAGRPGRGAPGIVVPMSTDSPAGPRTAGSTRAPTELRLLILADPGLPSHRISRARPGIEHRLERALGVPVLVRSEPFLAPITTDNALDIEDVDAEIADRMHADLVLLFTEMPRHDTHAVVAEVLPERGLAVISWPAAGVLSGNRRLTDILLACVERTGALEGAHAQPRRRPERSEWAPVPAAQQDRPDPGRARLHAPPLIGGLRTVIGMVVANEPWRTAPKLSRALAAASATGAFGIFYSSIWQMSDALSTPRLLGIGLLAISTMVAWLLASNSLWEKPRLETRTRVELLYNLSTVLTMFACVGGLYLLLALLILLGGLVVIDPDFMATMLEHPPSFTN